MLPKSRHYVRITLTLQGCRWGLGSFFQRMVFVGPVGLVRLVEKVLREKQKPPKGRGPDAVARHRVHKLGGFQANEILSRAFTCFWIGRPKHQREGFGVLPGEVYTSSSRAASFICKEYLLCRMNRQFGPILILIIILGRENYGRGMECFGDRTYAQFHARNMMLS